MNNELWTICIMRELYRILYYSNNPIYEEKILPFNISSSIERKELLIASSTRPSADCKYNVREMFKSINQNIRYL